MVRRTLDVIIAAVGLVLISPLLLVIGLAIAMTMGSPVLFRQHRSGRSGRIFTILKFRTMRKPRHPGESDAQRISPLGSLLRVLSLDELPQLWNVLKGDMSIIGPRPTLPEQVVHYSPRQRRRLEIRPGITGYAQVLGRNSLPWPERIELDIYYIEHRRISLDLWILARTVANLIRPQGILGEGGVNPGFPVNSSIR
jgi:lipopolysaccharide/colanic/teichoic acid biosynthesis glycosyltransferase